MRPKEPPDFGGLLRHHRLRASLSQEELAERAGLTASGISQLERGVRHRPQVQTVRALADALGLTAADRAELTALAHAAPVSPVTAASPPAAPPEAVPALGLPPTFTDLVGREHELTALALLLAGGTRLLTLTGAGGAGKTRLALALAEPVRGSFPGGVGFVDVSSITDPGLVLAALAQALG